MSGVLTSTETLKNYYLKNKFHTNVLCYKPLFDSRLIQKKFTEKKTQTFTVAIVGGTFRSGYLVLNVIPALNALSKRIPILLYIRAGILTPDLKEKSPFDFKEIEFNECYHQFILYLQTLNIDVLIHPGGITNNLKYKTNSILLTAVYIGANIIVTNEAAFKKTSIAQGVIKVKNSVVGYTKALELLLDPNLSEKIKKNLHNFCQKEFDICNNLKVLDIINKMHNQNQHYSFEDRNTRLVDYLYYNNLCNVRGNSLLEKIIIRIRMYSNKIIHRMRSYYERYNNYFRYIQELYLYNDLSSTINDNFKELIADVVNPNILQLSAPIQKRIYLQYYVFNPPQKIKKIAVGFHASKILKGQVGVEIVFSNGLIGATVMLDTKKVDFSKPVLFKLPLIELDSNSQIYARVFTRDVEHPIHAYEITKKGFGFKRQKQLLCKFN